MTPDPSREIDQVIEEMRATAKRASGNDWVPLGCASSHQLKRWAELLALLTAASPVSPDVRKWAQHNDDCPRAYDLKWATRHFEQHFDHADFRTCPDPVCTAWSKAARLRWSKVDCTCGLDAALASSPVSGEKETR